MGVIITRKINYHAMLREYEFAEYYHKKASDRSSKNKNVLIIANSD